MVYGKTLRGEMNLFRAMNWCLEPGVLRLVNKGVFFFFNICMC